MIRILFAFFSVLTLSAGLVAQPPVKLANDRLQLVWQSSPQGYRLQTVAARKGKTWVTLPTPSGEATLLYAAEKPNPNATESFKNRVGGDFPEPVYKYQ
ncbi:MAG: glycerophosphoryl diester phosphodiesterase, partial [Sphingobacteriaceae bacterium]|nr:glycerophosphoryl diester phosphodiesterase [Cytophagaceae bacterium]